MGLERRSNDWDVQGKRKLALLGLVLLAIAASVTLACYHLTSRPLSEDDAASLHFALLPSSSGVLYDGGNMAEFYLILRFKGRGLWLGSRRTVAPRSSTR